MKKQATDSLSVALETEKAPYYAGSYLENVTIAPSPQWSQNLLMNEGIRPINNVVDGLTTSCSTLVSLCMPLIWIRLRVTRSLCGKRVLVKNW